jgi:hypothetical protein
MFALIDNPLCHLSVRGQVEAMHQISSRCVACQMYCLLLRIQHDPTLSTLLMNTLICWYAALPYHEHHFQHLNPLTSKWIHAIDFLPSHCLMSKLSAAACWSLDDVNSTIIFFLKTWMCRWCVITSTRT